ncbi:hypothetical protein Pcinc_021144 [Petrolisthes cinctipes]|uniref:Uncharacterized protein n=1 Tax=Petrolisthes cinctipes TaxID=88211 RepID=A0AAE1FGZ0_PETCI|nr:hypothetical protein Pcinc_021144 [Petrolisthes cinctipes]
MWQEVKRTFELPKHDIDLSTRASSPTKKNTMPSCTVPKKRNYFGRTETSLLHDTVNLKLESPSVLEQSYSSSSSSPPLIDAQQPQQHQQQHTGFFYSHLPISTLSSYGNEFECMDVEDPTNYCNPPPPPPSLALPSSSSLQEDIESTLAGYGLKLKDDGNGVVLHDLDVTEELERYSHGTAYNCLSPVSNSG